MKATKYLAMAVMALAFAACSNEELASVKQQSAANSMKPVEFATVVNKQTRGTAYDDPQITSDNLGMFFIESTGTFYAADGTPVIAPKFTVSKESPSSTSWIYNVNDAETASTLYWPLEGTDATFSAWFYPGDSYNKGELDNRDANYDAVGAYKALSYTGSGDGPVVNLDFKHAVSKVEFKAKVLDKSDASPLNVKVFVRAICIKNVEYAASSYTASTSTTTMGAFNNTTDKRDIRKVIKLVDPDDDDWLTSTTDGDPSTDGRQAKVLGSQTKVFVMPQEIAAVEDFSTSTWSKPYISVLARICIDGGDADGTIIFPKGSGSNHHGWIALPLPANFTGFEAHKKYVFTLNFRNDALGLVDRDQNPNGDDDPCGPDATDELSVNETPGSTINIPGHSGFPLNVTVAEVYDFEEGGGYDVNNNAPAENIVDLSTLTADYIAQNGDVLTGTLINNVKISIAAGATVTQQNATINGVNNDSYAWAGITCLGNATIILSGTNTVKGFYEDYPGVYVPEGYTLTIQGTGSLTASSNGYGAGIGGYDISCGNIVINGGSITAYGGNSAAGIGAGANSTCGSISITNGTVVAHAGNYAAGIGAALASGNHSTCSGVSISGGSVTAYGGLGAAGIGSGLSFTGGNSDPDKYSQCGNISITGGTVVATGGNGTDIYNPLEDQYFHAYGGAGIGTGATAGARGYQSNCGNITIGTGVTSVTATKGDDAQNSIGKNHSSTSGTCGTVTIEDGANVTQN